MTVPPQPNFSLFDQLRLYPEVVIDRTINDVRPKLKVLLERLKNPEKEDDLGVLLEDIAHLLLESPYLELNKKRRNCIAGEIDLDFTVKKFPTTLFEEFSYLLIVESKNWRKKAGAPDLRIFRDKAREVKSNIGIFFSKNGITRDAEVIVRDTWMLDEIIIVVFDVKDLDKIINKSENFYTILHKKYLAVRTSSKE